MIPFKGSKIVWLNFKFFIKLFKFFIFFFYSEFVWLILYCLAVNVSILVDDLNTAGLTFFFLGLAGLEFAIGFILLTTFKNFKVSLNIFQNEKNKSFFFKNNKSTFFLENFF